MLVRSALRSYVFFLIYLVICWIQLESSAMPMKPDTLQIQPLTFKKKKREEMEFLKGSTNMENLKIKMA